jgi:hypothetical protein
MERALLAATLVVLLSNLAGAEQYKPSYRPNPSVSMLTERLMDYELRALGAEGLPLSGESLSKEQYEALMEEVFCFQNFSVPSAVYQSILQAEITELAMAGREPCEGYNRDGGLVVADDGSVRWTPHSRKPAPPYMVELNGALTPRDP